MHMWSGCLPVSFSLSFTGLSLPFIGLFTAFPWLFTAFHCQVGGIAVANLFRWNSLLLQLDARAVGSGGGEEEKIDDDCFVEYVHVAAGSAVVKAGQRVRRVSLSLP